MYDMKKKQAHIADLEGRHEELAGTANSQGCRMRAEQLAHATGRRTGQQHS